MEQATDSLSNFDFVGNKTDNMTNIKYSEYAAYSSIEDGNSKERTVYVFEKGNTVYVLDEFISAGENEDLKPMYMIMRTIGSN